MDAIEFAKRNESGLFVSGWDVDEEGVAEKDLMDPGEQVLTAAEDGDLELLKHLLSEDIQLLQVGAAKLNYDITGTCSLLYVWEYVDTSILGYFYVQGALLFQQNWLQMKI